MDLNLLEPGPGETFEGQWFTVAGKEFYVVEKPMPLYAIHLALGNMPVRLLRFQEFQRLRQEGFPFEEWNILGEVWTATRKSCSVQCAWKIKDDGSGEGVGWDKSFIAWVVAVRK